MGYLQGYREVDLAADRKRNMMAMKDAAGTAMSSLVDVSTLRGAGYCKPFPDDAAYHLAGYLERPLRDYVGLMIVPLVFPANREIDDIVRQQGPRGFDP